VTRGTVALVLAMPILATAQDGVPVERAARPVEATPANDLEQTYSARHALVVGIDHFKDAAFASLGHAVADAKAVAQLLIEKYAFAKVNVHLLLDAEATRDAIDRALQEWLCDRKRVMANDLVVVFFAGHGVTRESSHKVRGYLVPADGQSLGGEPAWSTLLSMDEIEAVSDFIPAKHALFILDCCFGGLVRKRAAIPVAAGLTRAARQGIPAGDRRQPVLDTGPGGHSVFTAALLDALRGVGDENADGVVTLGEVFNYVNRRVQTETEQKQTPLQVDFAGHDGGSVAFFPPGVRPTVTTAAERLRQLELSNEALQAENKRLADLAARRAA
jgi:uncharacterized caspase-like protein